MQVQGWYNLIMPLNQIYLNAIFQLKKMLESQWKIHKSMDYGTVFQQANKMHVHA